MVVEKQWEHTVTQLLLSISDVFPLAVISVTVNANYKAQQLFLKFGKSDVLP